MALRNKIFLACESFLRVPPLLIVDEIFRYSFGLGYGSKFKQQNGALLTLTSEDSFFGNNDDNDSSEEVLDNSNYTEVPEDAYDDEHIGLRYPQVQTDSEDAWLSSSWLKGVIPSVELADLLNYIPNQLYSASESAAASFDSIISAVPSPGFSQNLDPTTDPVVHLVQFEFGDFGSVKDVVTDDVFKVAEVLGCLLLFAAVLVVFVLSTKNLVKLYSYILAFSSLYVAYIISPLPISFTLIPSLFFNIFVRCLLAGIYFFTRAWPEGGYTGLDPRFSKLYSVLDSLIFSAFFITGFVRFQPFVYLGLMIILQTSLWISIPKLYEFLHQSWDDTKRTRNQFGLSHLIQVESGRLKIATVFRLFWVSRAVYDTFNRCGVEPFPQVLKYVLSNGSETLLGVTGLTVTVSAICHQIGAFLLWILYYGSATESDANRFGSISTVLFFILSLQTGLTTLNPEKRLDRLFKNIVLLGTALFHALHQVLAPLLHAFRSFQALQIRAAILAIIFLGVSIVSTVVLLRTSALSTWSLAVLALAIEFKIKILISLLISVVVYLSQLVQYPEYFQKIGQWLREILPQDIVRFFAQLHDQLSHEDMVFYLKSTAHMAEFITGIFLFLNAVWIFLFESASAIRAIGMAIHFYFNIWCEAKKGYRVYCQRRTASNKIESLSDASEAQLQRRRDDVCAICYEEMESAKVTHCGHLFHAVCLRKWLYVQNTCPLCHEVLYAVVPVTDAQRRVRNGGMVHLNGRPPVEVVHPNPRQVGAQAPAAVHRDSATNTAPLNANHGSAPQVPVLSSNVLNGNNSDADYFTPERRSRDRNIDSDNIDSEDEEASSSGAWTDISYELEDSEDFDLLLRPSTPIPPSLPATPSPPPDPNSALPGTSQGSHGNHKPNNLSPRRVVSL